MTTFTAGPSRLSIVSQTGVYAETKVETAAPGVNPLDSVSKEEAREFRQYLVESNLIEGISHALLSLYDEVLDLKRKREYPNPIQYTVDRLQAKLDEKLEKLRAAEEANKGEEEEEEVHVKRGKSIEAAVTALHDMFVESQSDVQEDSTDDKTLCNAFGRIGVTSGSKSCEPEKVATYVFESAVDEDRELDGYDFAAAALCLSRPRPEDEVTEEEPAEAEGEGQEEAEPTA